MPRGLRMLILHAITASVVLAFQQPEPPFRLRTDTHMVEVDVSVRDSRGRPVEDLKAADFTLTDNGKVRPITVFSATRNPASSDALPAEADHVPFARRVFSNRTASWRAPAVHSTIILLDGINGWFDNFNMARQGVLELLSTVAADENVALYALVNGIGMIVLQDYTRDKSRLASAVANFIPRGMHAAPPYLPEGAEGLMEDLRPGGGALRPNDYRFASELEKQAALLIASEDVRKSFEALAKKLRSIPGRKSVFWVTQGFPPSVLRDIHQADWNNTLTDLNDANIALNTVDSNGLGGPPRYWGPGAILTMQQLAERTGGQSYFQRNDLGNALASGVAASRTNYVLGFYVTALDGKYHELKVRVARPGLELRHRHGYYARSDGTPARDTKETPLDAELLNPGASNGVGIVAKYEIVPGDPRATLKVYMTLAPEGLTVTKSEAGYRGRIDELFVVSDRYGRTGWRLSHENQFTIRPEFVEMFDAKGVTMTQVIPMAAGATKLTVVVRDTKSGRVGSLVIPLEADVPEGQQ